MNLSLSLSLSPSLLCIGHIMTIAKLQQQQCIFLFFLSTYVQTRKTNANTCIKLFFCSSCSLRFVQLLCIYLQETVSEYTFDSQSGVFLVSTQAAAAAAILIFF